MAPNVLCLLCKCSFGYACLSANKCVTLLPLLPLLLPPLHSQFTCSIRCFLFPSPSPSVRLTVYLSLYYVTAHSLFLLPLPLTRLTTAAAAAMDGDLMTRVKLQLGVNWRCFLRTSAVANSLAAAAVAVASTARRQTFLLFLLKLYQSDKLRGRNSLFCVVCQRERLLSAAAVVVVVFCCVFCGQLCRCILLFWFFCCWIAVLAVPNARPFIIAAFAAAAFSFFQSDSHC